MMDYFIQTVLLTFTVSAVFTEACYKPGFTGSSCNKYNFAYKKGASQNEVWASHSAGYAVDDDQATCTVTNPPVQNPWWQVDLGKEMRVEGIYILFADHTKNAIQMYTVEVQKDGSDKYSMCNDHNGPVNNNPIDIRCRNTLQGRYVKFTIHHELLNMSICDVGVYGTCVDMSYGDYCENECGHCHPSNLVCNKYTGRCINGCDTGYYNSTCKDICPFGTYGDQCSQKCGNCANNVTCNRFDGECPDLGVCDPGYVSPMCQNECPDGTYGLGCIDCGKCKITTCNKINGTCTLPECTETFNGTCVESPCLPGYKGTDEMCATKCDDGFYGDSCVEECGFCTSNISSTGPCNNINGKCDFGCAPGYYEDSTTKPSETQCRKECPDGKWGTNCQETCGNCDQYQLDNGTRLDIPCSKSDGSCPQCKAGWQGALCIDVCTPGTYGYNCAQLCGKCRDDVACDKINGQCPGDCQDGYLGQLCNQECTFGYYGYKCTLKCPVNCATNCTVTDGTCVCKDGWTGPKCQDVCPHNHYGKNCENVCANCKPGTTCNQGNGHCEQGCDVDWTGRKCDAKVIRETYERSYADVIGGSIGGAIALGLIIAFVVWVVWRYKQDKSIHIRELASSLRRMSIRGSKSLRRSLQRLSMRGRRNDQQRLDSNSEAPAMSNGTRAHKAKIPRMYENIRVHSNTIHYDDFSRLYLQLQESKSDGKTLLYDSFQSFMAQRPRDSTPNENGTNHAYYNTALDDIQVHVDSDGEGSSIPEFLPLGTNLSGFLLINAPAASTLLWNHLQQRQIETIISIGKEASFTWRPGERITIGPDVVECIDVQLHTSHRETKLTVQRQGVRGRRGVRHLECFFWTKGERFPLVPTLLNFMERFQHINYAQRERIILVNYTNSYNQAVLFTLVASMLEILNESKRADILRTVATGGKATVKSIRTFDEFKYLHDVVFQYIRTIENNATSTAI